jgi:uncharacterized phage protein gp47/JayE
MSTEDLLHLDPCGCCQAQVPPTPEEITNRPGLPAIRYRIGRYPSFHQAMIEKISSKKVEADGKTFLPLRGWTTRASDDYGIAVLEMWSYLADILTFYQERIANESFLRTAVLTESVQRLAALLGYEPAPGVAATTHLVFTLEKGKQVQIPVGLRIQSVPGQNEKPQKFEAVETVAADARLNAVPVFPEAQEDIPLAASRDWAILRPDNAGEIASKLAPADRLVIFNEAGPQSKIEERAVEAVEVAAGCTTLRWSPLMRDDFGDGRMFKWQRKFRLFGYNAPESYLQAEPAAPGSTDIRWTRIEEGPPGDYRFDLNSATLELDALYDDLRVGTLVLVVAPDSVTLARIGSTERKNQTRGPLSDTVTQITLSEPDQTGQNATVEIANLRTATVYELDDEIHLWKHRYPDALEKGTDVVFLPSSQPATLARGHILILDDKIGVPQTVTCAGVDLVEADDGGPERLRIKFTPELKRTLDTETAVLYGNVALATHGETVAREVLGSGDASAAFQSFPIRKSPVTFVPQPGASHSVANTLQVRVDGVLWDSVNNLYGHGGEERIYTTRVDDAGVMVVRFGDGKTGARLPSGRDNIVASYRQGLGRDGIVRANSLTTLLDRPVGLKSVRNPAKADNGDNPETMQEARAKAPNTVRTFGRIVSLRDFEDAARESVGVAKARASWRWDGEEQVVYLTVAGNEGAEIVGEPRKNLVNDLNSRRDPNRKMEVVAHCGIPVQVVASIKVHPAYVPEEVRVTAQKALQDYFAFDNLEFGQPINLSDIYRTLQDVTGVIAVDIDCLQFKKCEDRDSHGATTQPVQGRLRISPTELAFIQDSVTDAIVNIREGQP